MDHKKQGMGVLLAGALLLGGLAGCQSEPAADDVTYRLTGIRRDAPLVTVDGREVAAEDYLFWLSQDHRSRVCQERRPAGGDLSGCGVQ